MSLEMYDKISLQILENWRKYWGLGIFWIIGLGILLVLFIWYINGIKESD